MPKSKYGALVTASAAGLLAIGLSGACSSSKQTSKEPATPAEEETRGYQSAAPEATSPAQSAEQGPTTPPAGGGHLSGELGTHMDMSARIINEVATARCDRDNRCGNIGTDQKYATRDECIKKLEASYKDLRPEECPSGIDRSKLDTCLASIRSEDCGSSLDNLQMLAACRSGALCMD